MSQTEVTKYGKFFDLLGQTDYVLSEIPTLIVAGLWTILTVMTHHGIIGAAGLAILYRRYSKKRKDKERLAELEAKLARLSTKAEAEI